VIVARVPAHEREASARLAGSFMVESCVRDCLWLVFRLDFVVVGCSIVE
jgi:hypothetical protein